MRGSISSLKSRSRKRRICACKRLFALALMPNGALCHAGIGSFTIVDGASVSEADLGNNFFVEHSSLGSSRAACVTRLLQELNEHVSGSYVAEDIAQVRLDTS